VIFLPINSSKTLKYIFFQKKKVIWPDKLIPKLEVQRKKETSRPYQSKKKKERRRVENHKETYYNIKKKERE
jgi:hypothetical protein